MADHYATRCWYGVFKAIPHGGGGIWGILNPTIKLSVPNSGVKNHYHSYWSMHVGEMAAQAEMLYKGAYISKRKVIECNYRSKQWTCCRGGAKV